MHVAYHLYFNLRSFCIEPTIIDLVLLALICWAASIKVCFPNYYSIYRATLLTLLPLAV